MYPGFMFGPQGGVYRDYFTFKAFKECVYLTFIQRNSHFYIMPTSVSLFSCHILTKKQKLFRS